MKKPISYRKGIPFYYDKTEADYKADLYERYDDMVVRQSALHLADDLWGAYPMQAILDFAKVHYPDNPNHIVEIGSGVGRWIASLAQGYPKANCWGIDYSYQMLKRAKEFWMDGKDIMIDLSCKGFPKTLAKGHQLTNLQLGLAKGENLPFANDSQDLVLNSFLLDRLDDPVKGLAEMYRVLKVKGKLILITPLNFKQAKHWESLYPTSKIRDLLHEIGFEILHWQEGIRIEEPLDFHGNGIAWRCLGLVLIKQ